MHAGYVETEIEEYLMLVTIHHNWQEPIVISMSSVTESLSQSILIAGPLFYASFWDNVRFYE